MRNLILLTFLGIFSLSIYSQTCDPPTNLTQITTENNVKLTWSTPLFTTSAKHEQIIKPISSPQSDISSTINSFHNLSNSRDYLDLQFSFPCVVRNGEAGVASDGTYIYSSIWSGESFVQYNIDGQKIDTFTIAGVSGIRNIVYCDKDGYYYGSNPIGDKLIYVMDFENHILINTLTLSVYPRALGYNNELDVLYTNNWSSDISVIDRQTGSLINSVPLTGSYGNFYGFAYDNWSDNGPYLWGFSHDGSGSEIVQFSLPDIQETGFAFDVSYLASGFAGGLFTTTDLIEGKSTLGGLIQNEVIFGFELGNLSPPPPSILTGYNIYRNGDLINTSIITDTTFDDTSLDPGTYSYTITALYDTLGTYYCESYNSNEVLVAIEDQLLLGGNVFTGSFKLDKGKATGYSVSNDEIIFESSVDIDNLGYYFFFPYQTNDYYVVANPTQNSIYFQNFIPTYYGNVYHWEDSPVIHLENNQYNEDINLIALEQSNLGIGSISGIVNLESKNFDYNPGANILLLLLNIDNRCISFDYTNDQGTFNFNQLENGTYKLLCEIIGKKMTPRIFVIDNNNPDYNNINLIVKSDEIISGIGDEFPESVTFVSDIYPNPSHDFIMIDISLTRKEIVTIEITDITGRVVDLYEYELNIGANQIKVTTSSLDMGFAILNIRFKNYRSIVRKFIVN